MLTPHHLKSFSVPLSIRPLTPALTLSRVSTIHPHHYDVDKSRVFFGRVCFFLVACVAFFGRACVVFFGRARVWSCGFFSRSRVCVFFFSRSRVCVVFLPFEQSQVGIDFWRPFQRVNAFLTKHRRMCESHFRCKTWLPSRR